MLQPPPAKYGGRHTVTLIPGDGIGPELLNHVREVFRLVRIKSKPCSKCEPQTCEEWLTMCFVL